MEKFYLIYHYPITITAKTAKSSIEHCEKWKAEIKIGKV